MATSPTFDRSSALVVVDVQNDFADPDGALAVPGGPDVVAAVNELVAAATAADAFVVYTQDWHPSQTPHFQEWGGPWPVHCVQDSWGAEFHPDLDVVGPSVRKGVEGGDGYSGFSVRDPESGDEHATELARLLREHGASRVVICGLALDYCVRATALDAADEGFDTVLAAAATRAVDMEAGDGFRTVAELARAGVDVQ